MKTTVQWLDQAKARHGLSDYALAPRLGVTKSQMSRYRTGADFLSDDAALKLAALLDVDPRPVIASAQAERAKTPEARAFWQRWAAAMVAAVAFTGGPTPPPANAAAGANSAPLYIMSNGTRKRRRKGAMAHVAGALARMRDALAPHALLIPA